MAFDKHLNLVLSESEEFRTLKSKGGATLLEENDKELTLKMPDGKTQIVPVSEVKERQPPMSAMPPIGLLMTKRELRDLVAYLQGR